MDSAWSALVRLPLKNIGVDYFIFLRAITCGQCAKPVLVPLIETTWLQQ